MAIKAIRYVVQEWVSDTLVRVKISYKYKAIFLLNRRKILINLLQKFYCHWMKSLLVKIHGTQKSSV